MFNPMQDISGRPNRPVSNRQHKDGDLQVWWIPQIGAPIPSFNVDVPTLEAGVMLLGVLAYYDLYQLERRIKPDFSNAGGLNVYRDGEWESWEGPDGEDDPEEYLKNKKD